MVRIDGVVQPAMKWSHWHAASDQTDRAGRCYNSKADRVMKELWDYYTLAEGVRREDADDVVNRVCVHRVQDLFYETKLLCRRIYHARRGNRVTRAQAVHLPLTKEQYLTVPPAWCAGMDNCWEAIVDTWLSEEYEQYHAVRSRCRAMMQGSSHKQGPTTLKEYAARYTRFHPGQECASFKAYALAHKGKAKDPDLVYNPEDPPEAYSNLSVHSRLSEYTAMRTEPNWF
ncbi:uncharacterized protein [Miscanthus floridulus]|uniref:uncharacterized protein n=1 Tax=Miscanthus floridulus TaxID=154761 RepID=UPI003458530E